MIRNAENKILFKDCIVKVYRVAAGPLPDWLKDASKVGEDADMVGIVMRYEVGGSLQRTSTHIRELPVPMIQKIRLLKGFTKGLAELHAVGIVHAEIKPDNIPGGPSGGFRISVCGLISVTVLRTSFPIPLSSPIDIDLGPDCRLYSLSTLSVTKHTMLDF